MILKIEVDELVFKRYVQAVAANRGYQPTIKDSEGNEIDNPVSANSVFRDALLRFCEDELLAYETRVIVPEPQTPDITISIE